MYKYYYVVGGLLSFIAAKILITQTEVKSFLTHSMLMLIVLVNSAWGYVLFMSYSPHIGYNVIGYCVIISQLMLLTRDADNGRFRNVFNDFVFTISSRLFI